MAENRETGSSTCVIVTLDLNEPKINACNLGDSGYLILRKQGAGDLVQIFKTTERTHAFNFPTIFYLKEQSRASLGKIKSGYIANEAGDQGLARRNLTNIYGRVRNKYNEQIRQGGAALKFNPHKAGGRAGSPKQ